MTRPIPRGQSVSVAGLLLTALAGACIPGCAGLRLPTTTPVDRQLVRIQDRFVALGSHGWALLLTVKRLSPSSSDAALSRFRLLVEGPMEHLGLVVTEDDIIVSPEARWGKRVQVWLPADLVRVEGECAPSARAVSRKDLRRAVPDPSDPSVLLVTPTPLPDDELPCFLAGVDELTPRTR